MLSKSTLMVVLAGALVAGFQQSAEAQYKGGSNAYTATRNFLYNRPTVSPYLNLTSRSSNGISNYHTMVRPQLDQEQTNLRRQQQANRQQQEMGQIQSQFRQSQSQAAQMMITGRVGWSSRGMPRHGSYLNFYPGMHRIGR